MKELSEKWFIEVTEDNFNIIDKWVFKNNGYHPTPPRCVSYKGSHANRYFYQDNNYTEITIEQFKKYILKENMKTQLLGLPVIRGEKHHLEAFVKDIAALGYKPSISCIKEYTLLQHNCHGSDIFLSNKDIFRDIYMGSNVNHSTIFPTKEFQLLQDWSKALDFMKENMDRWLKIQEENKEPEFKVGDIVVAGNPNVICDAKGRTGRIESIIPGNHPYNINFGSNLIVWCQIERLATPQEIEEYNNKPKIFKMTSTSGNFELEVSKKGIYYRPEDKWLHTAFLWEFTNKGCKLPHQSGGYSVEVTKVDVGCKKDCLVSQFQEVYNYYKSLQ